MDLMAIRTGIVASFAYVLITILFGIAVSFAFYLQIRKYRVPSAKNGDPNAQRIESDLPISQQNKEAIARVYAVVLERPVDDIGLKIYGRQLQRREKTLRMIVRELCKSEEYFDRFVNLRPPREAVILLYRHILCRTPDYQEINTEIPILNTQNWQNIVDRLISSDEYLKKFGEHAPPCTAD